MKKKIYISPSVKMLALDNENIIQASAIVGNQTQTTFSKVGNVSNFLNS